MQILHRVSITLIMLHCLAVGNANANEANLEDIAYSMNGRREFFTNTPWIHNLQGATYSGPTLSSIMKFPYIKVTGKDGYSCIYSRSELIRDKPILATMMNNHPISEPYGPFWVMYDFKQPHLNNLHHYDRAIWNVGSIRGIKSATPGCKTLPKSKD